MDVGRKSHHGGEEEVVIMGHGGVVEQGGIFGLASTLQDDSFGEVILVLGT